LAESQKAMGDQRNIALAQYYAGLAHEGLKQFDLGIQAYQQSLKVSTQVPEAAYALGVLYYSRGNYPKAKVALAQFTSAMQNVSAEKRTALQPQINYANAVLKRL
jgi:tetratricopeptide (TPR) repeat protein